MKILTSLTYYSPYVSGVSVYAQRLARALVERGHRVVVLTARYQKGLKLSEDQEGVKIVRIPVWWQLNKGVFMPAWLFRAWSLLTEADICLIHLPQPAGLFLAVMARLRGKRTIGVYHCEVVLPPGGANRLVTRLVSAVTLLTGFFLDQIVAYTEDYAVSSVFLKRFGEKTFFILPPIEVVPPTLSQTRKMAKKIGRRRGEIVVGFAGRVATEKGIEHLLEAVSLLTKKGKKIRLLIAGPAKEVVGEREYGNRIGRLSRRQRERTVFLGSLDQADLGAFYRNINVLVLPSLNRTESFGLVQAEAMLFGVPVVVSNLPGVRVPVRLTGMGKVVPPGNARRLAEAIESVGRRKYWPKRKVQAIFSAAKTYDEYENLISAPVHIFPRNKWL